MQKVTVIIIASPASNSPYGDTADPFSVASDLHCETPIAATEELIQLFEEAAADAKERELDLYRYDPASFFEDEVELYRNELYARQWLRPEGRKPGIQCPLIRQRRAGS